MEQNCLVKHFAFLKTFCLQCSNFVFLVTYCSFLWAADWPTTNFSGMCCYTYTVWLHCKSSTCFMSDCQHINCDKVIDLEISSFVAELSSLDSCLNSLFLLVWEKYCVESNFKLYDKETKLTNSGSLMESSVTPASWPWADEWAVGLDKVP